MERVMPQQVPTVPASEVPEDAVVLDVREDDEWVHGHIEGATHIPMGDVPSRLDDLPEGDPLSVTCRGGGRSGRVAAWLNQNGYDAVNVAGGMGQWEAAGKPMVSETGEPPFARRTPAVGALPAASSGVRTRRTSRAGPSWRTCRRWSWAPRR